MSTKEDNEIEKFKNKSMFIIYPIIGSGWVLEVYDVQDRLKGRLVMRDRNELIQALEDALDEDSPDIEFEEN